jgi:hypothetical protein
MRTAMSDLMDKNRVGSAGSTALGGRSDGSIINDDTDMSIYNISDNGPKRKRNMHRNPQSELSSMGMSQNFDRKSKTRK